MTRTMRIVFSLGLSGSAFLLCGDENLKMPAQTTATNHFDFAPGGTIRITRSYGDLYIEGWDKPQVELTAVKTMPYEYQPAHPELSSRHLEALHVNAELRSPSELVISTPLPQRKRHLPAPLPATTTGGVGLEYQLHVPRRSNLMIEHKVGYVSISGVIGDVDATCHRGDIVLWLPGGETYSIDARSKLGKVYSDFPGDSLAQLLVGQSFVGSTAGGHKLHLRTGFGGITLKPILTESLAVSRR